MPLDLTEEQRAAGRKNFDEAAGELTRRGFMKSMVAAGAVLPLSAAVYFGYESWRGNKAVRTALIGCGDEGGVLIGDHNPEFNEIVAVCDIRPYNQKRIFTGEPNGPRKGLNKIYGKDTAAKIAKYDDYKTLLTDISKLNLEAVIIAVPLHLHASMANDCMKAGLHVLCEKLMARTIPLCKDMIKTAKDEKVLLNIGHQRHYSMLYAHATEVVNSGVLGDVKHIKAQWPRNNSWPYDPKLEKEPVAKGFKLPELRDGWYKPIYEVDAEAAWLKDADSLKKLGYTSLEELVRWRCYNRTGGGLMAELGSHQLDAASIFLGHVHPIAVSGVGGKFFYGPGKNDRESDDSVFVHFEFPGKNHPHGPNKGKDENDVVVVGYTSFNTNSFEDYGECLMGSRGTMIVAKEADVFLYKEPEPGKSGSGGRDTAIRVTAEKAGGASMAASSTWGGGGAAITKAAGASAWDTPVRGYRSEMEHFAYCVRKWDKAIGWEKKDGKFVQEVPRCYGEVAMADAIIALTANMAMKSRQRIEFEPNWFAADKPDCPESKYDKEILAKS
jgi:predicted dehydrogenase